VRPCIKKTNNSKDSAFLYKSRNKNPATGRAPAVPTCVLWQEKHMFFSLHQLNSSFKGNGLKAFPQFHVIIQSCQQSLIKKRAASFDFLKPYFLSSLTFNQIRKSLYSIFSQFESCPKSLQLEKNISLQTRLLVKLPKSSYNTN
jgi:hypothetical protein